MKQLLFLLLAAAAIHGSAFVYAESIYSPAWGFFMDLPEGYELTDGDGKDRFSFSGPAGLKFDLVVYDGRYNSLQDLVIDINKRIGNSGDGDFFNYNDKEAAVLELNFGAYAGFGLCVELAQEKTNSAQKPMLAALAYSTKDLKGMEIFHLSALDSIAPSVSERLIPGPITHYSFPRGAKKSVNLAGGVAASVYENDAEAAQVLIEREYAILTAYLNTAALEKAWIRYYRFIFRDSFDRIVEPAYALAQAWGGISGTAPMEKRVFAQKALRFVQEFAYERNPDGSDFLNLVTAVTERRGDCDSRAMLWAIILTCAEIRAGIMVSHHYSHAMGLADLEGTGARFDFLGVNWLVAETTADVDIGLIAQDVSDPRHWIGIAFE